MQRFWRVFAATIAALVFASCAAPGGGTASSGLDMKPFRDWLDQHLAMK